MTHISSGSPPFCACVIVIIELKLNLVKDISSKVQIGHTLLKNYNG